jgi:hypothetical protein
MGKLVAEKVCHVSPEAGLTRGHVLQRPGESVAAENPEDREPPQRIERDQTMGRWRCLRVNQPKVGLFLPVVYRGGPVVRVPR